MGEAPVALGLVMSLVVNTCPIKDLTPEMYKGPVKLNKGTKTTVK